MFRERAALHSPGLAGCFMLTPSADKSLHSDCVRPVQKHLRRCWRLRKRLIVFQVPTSQGANQTLYFRVGAWPALGLCCGITSPGSSVLLFGPCWVPLVAAGRETLLAAVLGLLTTQLLSLCDTRLQELGWQLWLLGLPEWQQAPWNLESFWTKRIEPVSLSGGFFKHWTNQGSPPAWVLIRVPDPVFTWC